MKVAFKKARMIFPAGHRSDPHVFAGFYTTMTYGGSGSGCVGMIITASAFYKLYVNGEFVIYGPARAAHEYARVDTPDITRYLKSGENHIAAEVIGYAGRVSLAGTGEPAFFIAEISVDGNTVSWTGDGCWKTFLLPHKDLGLTPFSHARFWQENYTVSPASHDWMTGGISPAECEAEEISGGVTFIPRTASYPDFSVIDLNGACYTRGIKKAAMTDVIDVVKAENESYIDFDFGEFRSGFIGLEFECGVKCNVKLMYQEKISREEGEFTDRFSGQTAYTRASTNIEFLPGINKFETFEAYAVRYLRIIVSGTESYTIRRLYVRLCQIKDLNGGGFQCSDGELNRIYRANRTSLIINTFDTFMDCAQRERGSGWNDACYWVSRASQFMLGDVSAEKCYLENQIADTVKKYCDLPYACYPASYRCVIHNWTIYLLLELYDYYIRTADINLLTDHIEGIRFLVDSLNRYKNKYGLLEKLDEIVYTSSYTTSHRIEQNSVYNQPISTITNFMFARAIIPLGKLLGIDEWTAQGEAIESLMKKVADSVSDHEEIGAFMPSSVTINDKGEPVSTGYESEGGQYFWIMYGYFNKNNLPMKLARMFEHMGPAPDEKYSHDLYSMKRMGYEGDIFARIEALSMYEQSERIIKEIKSYGLWAMDRFAGLFGEGWDWFSCNHHSFNAYFNYAIVREILGLDVPNEVEKTINIAPHICSLKWAKGHTTTSGGICSVHWTDSGDRFMITAEVPESYTVLFKVPAAVTGYDRIYTLNEEKTDIPENGLFKLNSGFLFESVRRR